MIFKPLVPILAVESGREVPRGRRGTELSGEAPGIPAERPSFAASPGLQGLKSTTDSGEKSLHRR